MGMGGIFNHDQLVPLGDGHDGVHVRDLAGHVHRHDGAGARRDGGFDGLGVEVEGFQVNVREHRHGVGLDHRRRGGEERVRRHDHLVLGLDAGGHQGDTQRDGAVDHADAVLGAVHGGEALLEFSDLRAVELAPLAAAERAQQPLFLRLAEDRPGGEGTGADRLPTENSQGL